MPSSHLYQINEIVELIVLSKPKKLLDIGVGFGKFGFLSREYLELWDGEENYEKWTHTIDGIEAFPKYLTPVHKYIYNKIYTGDALKIIPGIKKKYDLILLIDVLEHFTKKDGTKLLKECLKITNNILISTPLDIGDQEDCFDNPYEIHKYQWTKEDLSIIFANYDKKYVKNMHSIIGFFGKDVEMINSAQKENQRIIRESRLPIASYPRRIYKKIVKR